MLPDLFTHRKSPDFVNPDKNSKKNIKSSLFSLKSLQNSSKLMSLPPISPKKKQNFLESSALSQENEQKLKGLEEIGIFSEFSHSKKIFFHEDNETTIKHTTIHITDFMKKDQKMKLCRIAGGLQAYIIKKNEFQKNLMKRETMFKKFFYVREKLPFSFQSPQVSPRYVHDSDFNKYPEDNTQSQKILKINRIIEKCEEYISHKSPSPRLVILENN